MFPPTDKSWCDYRALNQNWSYQPTLAGRAIYFSIVFSAIRQAYIQNGGNDPEVLYQMSKMQADAQAIEDQMKNRQPEKPKGKYHKYMCMDQAPREITLI